MIWGFFTKNGAVPIYDKLVISSRLYEIFENLINYQKVKEIT